MDVSGMNSLMVSYQQASVQRVSVQATSVSAEVSASAAAEEEPAAVFEPSPKVESVDYSEKISAMMAEAKQRIADFQNLFVRYLGGQATQYDVANWSKSFLEGAFQKATPEDVAAAQAAISEGGYYSVDSVATRIMDMAMALSGGDSSKIELLRNAVEEGFAQAGSIYGGELPGICHDTYDEIMSRFDAWEGKDVEAPAEEAAPAEKPVEQPAEKPEVDNGGKGHHHGKHDRPGRP